MRLKLTLLLLALNAGVFYLIYDLQKQHSLDDALPGESKLLGPEVMNVRELRISGARLERPFVLQLEEENWRIVEPVDWPANPVAIDTILSELQFLRKQATFQVNQIVGEDQSLADFGLQQPAMTLTISDGQTPRTLEIGAPTEVGNRLYIRGPDPEEIHVVDQAILRALVVGLGDLRDRRVSAIPDFEVESLVIRRSGEGNVAVHLARDRGGEWEIEAPIRARANGPEVRSAVAGLTRLQVVSFADDTGTDLGRYGLANPQLRITLNGYDAIQTLLVGAPVESGEGDLVYAKIESQPSVFIVDGTVFEPFRNAQERLRERALFAIEPQQVSGLTMTGAYESFTLQEVEDGTWQIIDREGGDMRNLPADREVIHRFLDRLLNVRAEQFVNDAPTAEDRSRMGFNEPQGVIEVDAAGRSRRLSFGNIDIENDLLYASFDDSPFIFGVAVRNITLLQFDPLFFRRRVLEVLPRGARIQSMRIVDLRSDEVLFERELSPNVDSWTKQIGRDGSLEDEAVLALVAALRNFQVARFTRPRFGEYFEQTEERTIPWAYRIEAEIRLDGGREDQREVREYYATERLSGTRQGGGSPLHDCVFILPRNLMDALQILAVDREVPPIYEPPDPEVYADELEDPAAIDASTAQRTGGVVPPAGPADPQSSADPATSSDEQSDPVDAVPGETADGEEPAGEVSTDEPQAENADDKDEGSPAGTDTAPGD